MPCEGLVRLRRAEPDDAQGIAEVHVGTWRDAYRGLVPDELLAALSVERRKGFWQREIELAVSDHRPWIATCEETIVGFAHAGISRDDAAPGTTGEVYAIYVDPACWNRGIGRDLLDHAVRDLQAHGFGRATLWVLRENARARDFYEKQGWRPDGTERHEERLGSMLSEVRYAIEFA